MAWLIKNVYNIQEIALLKDVIKLINVSPQKYMTIVLILLKNLLKEK